MKITRRQLRKIIQEEFGYTKGGKVVRMPGSDVRDEIKEKIGELAREVAETNDKLVSAVPGESQTDEFYLDTVAELKKAFEALKKAEARLHGALFSKTMQFQMPGQEPHPDELPRE